MSERLAVKSANRVLDLFELLGRWGGEMSHTEIATTLKIPKSSLTQLLSNLVARGYVEFVSDTRGYRIGPSLETLVARIDQDRTMHDLALPALAEITRLTGESSALNVMHGDTKSKVVASINSAQRLISHMRTGDLAPLHATSGGKAILAFLSEVARERFLKRFKPKVITKNTVTAADDLRRQIKTIRRDGVAFAFAEFTNGIVGIAVPVLASSGLALGSINIAMPAVRYSPAVRDRAIPILKSTAETLQRQLAHGEPARSRSRARS